MSGKGDDGLKSTDTARSDALSFAERRNGDEGKKRGEVPNLYDAVNAKESEKRRETLIPGDIGNEALGEKVAEGHVT
jgi:hypothetical protein